MDTYFKTRFWQSNGAWILETYGFIDFIAHPLHKLTIVAAIFSKM